MATPPRAPNPKNVRICGCSGSRWCASCLDPEVREARGMDPPTELPAFLREPPEGREPVRDPRLRIVAFDPSRGPGAGCPEFEGVHLCEDLLSDAEAERLVEAIECEPFRLAQSGKQKQHYGARVNFNERKVQVDGFEGLPAWAGWLEARTRMRLASDAEEEACGGRSKPGAVVPAALLAAMATFRTTDVFVLRYRQQDRSNLDFHVDDTFAYGEAILALSLESDSVMTFLRERAGVDSGWDCVRVRLPARSMSIVYGAARFDWQHAILPYDIQGRRTSITLRTLSRDLRETAVGRAIEAPAARSPAAGRLPEEA